jgi:hypothetical protein
MTPTKNYLDKTYLGDGVYASYSMGDVILTTENGVSTTNKIVLDAGVVEHLLAYIKAHS